jgi:hypothetical protein
MTKSTEVAFWSRNCSNMRKSSRGVEREKGGGKNNTHQTYPYLSCGRYRDETLKCDQQPNNTQGRSLQSRDLLIAEEHEGGRGNQRECTSRGHGGEAALSVMQERIDQRAGKVASHVWRRMDCHTCLPIRTRQLHVVHRILLLPSWKITTSYSSFRCCSMQAWGGKKKPFGLSTTRICSSSYRIWKVFEYDACKS